MSLLGWVPLAAAATLAGVHLPPAVSPGETRLELVSCGVRDTLWIEHYVAGLYVAPGAPLESVRDPRRPKAVRLQVVEARWLPDQIPANGARRWSASSSESP